MIDETFLTRLADSVAPSDTLRQKIKSRVVSAIRPESLLRTVESVHVSDSFSARVLQRLHRRIGVTAAEDLRNAATSTEPSSAMFHRLRARVLSSLSPMEETSLFASSLKWVSAFAVFLVIVRSLPVIFLAPSTSAEAGVQLLPVDGSVAVYVGGVWQDVSAPEMLTNATMIRTGADSHATVIMNDDGVFRLGPDSLFKLHDLADRPTTHSAGPTATLLRGELWILGLLPPVTDGLSVEVSRGLVTVNVGSIGIKNDGTESSITVYDRGATVQYGKQTVFAVTGERVLTRSSASLHITPLPVRAFAEPWAVKNLEQDAVHRNEIAKLQEDRRDQIAGILPTSFFYPAKRLAEHVDVFFTLTHDGRTEKRVAQANTRLNEAIALMKVGQSDEAAISLSEYKDSLVSMAADTKDNLVKHLLRKQIADASTTIASPDATTNVELLKSALSQVGDAIPNAALDAKDIEGYVLVNRLVQINQQLSNSRDVAGAVAAYAEIRPYIQSLLAENSGVHPLLQKEATSLLVTTSLLLKDLQKTNSDAVITALASDIAPYIPLEDQEIVVSEAELNQRVQGMYARIFIFRAPLSRYNQLQVEMASLRGDPNRGTLLRRLKAALPEFLGEYVNTEVKLLGDELKSNAKNISTHDDSSVNTPPNDL